MTSHSRHLVWHRALAVVLTAVALGTVCSKPTPVEPDPPVSGSVPSAPTNLRVGSLDEGRREIVIAWDAVSGADRYVVEYWNLYGPGTPVTTLSVPSPDTTATLRDVPGDVLSVAVRAANSNGTSERSRPVLVQILAKKPIVEALFFGTGPYGTGLFSAVPGGLFLEAPLELQAHADPGRMLGWKAGKIPVRVESGITAEQLSALVRVFDHVSNLTEGELRPEIVERADRLPGTFQLGELHVIVRDDIGSSCGPPPVDGCAPQSVAGGQIVAATIILRRSLGPDAIVHEVGHAVLGLHHIWHVQLEPRPVMAPAGGPSEGYFSSLEVDAVRAVYRAGLRHGATKDAFRQLGLID